MLKRFLELKGPVRHVLDMLGKASMFPDEEQLKMIEDIVEVLQWVECTTRALCRRDISLAKSDQACYYPRARNF